MQYYRDEHHKLGLTVEEQLLECMCLSFWKVSFPPYHQNVKAADPDTALEQVRGWDRSSMVVLMRHELNLLLI